MRRQRTDSDGFTLVETMIAMVVFLIGALAMVSLMYAVIRANRNAFVLTEAVTAGRMEVERIMAIQPDAAASCNAPVAGTFAGNFGTNDCVRQIIVMGHTDPNRTTGTVFQIDNVRVSGVAPNQAFITVNVRWAKDEEERAIPVGQAGFIDCLDPVNVGKCSLLTLQDQKI